MVPLCDSRTFSNACPVNDDRGANFRCCLLMATGKTSKLPFVRRQSAAGDEWMVFYHLAMCGNVG